MQCCSFKPGTLRTSRQCVARRNVPLRIRANAEPENSTSTSPITEPPSQTSEEARIERLEANARRRAAPSMPSARPIPIKGMSIPKENTETSAYWREGQLFPDGWEQMSLPQKINEIYVGDRGLLFWLNKIAYAACFGLVGLWVLFRFIGPTLGLYELSI